MRVSESNGPEMSEAEAREYVEKMRSAPAEQIVADVIFSVLNAAQVKLGRRDARLFIDLSGTVLDQVRGEISDDLAKQVDAVLGQLRLGQVQAEAQVAASGKDEPNDLDHAPTPPSATADRPVAPAAKPAAQPQPQSGPASQSKLWVPGRDF